MIHLGVAMMIFDGSAYAEDVGFATPQTHTHAHTFSALVLMKLVVADCEWMFYNSLLRGQRYSQVQQSQKGVRMSNFKFSHNNKLPE